MKISASVYSNAAKSLTELVAELDRYGVDFLHLDCKDDPAVLNDIPALRQKSQTPIDLHLITASPERYEAALNQTPVEMVTFQHENLTDGLTIELPAQTQLGVALTTETPVEAFAVYADRANFVLFMTTVPGESGGRFNRENFQRIRAFQKRFPDKAIHVDGGVNNEVAFILRTLGVNVIVSGSYLVNADSIGHSILELKRNWVDSPFSVSDFMIGLDDTPVLRESELNLPYLLVTIDACNLGFAAVADDENRLSGIVTNADIRRGLMKNLKRLDDIRLESFINRQPFSTFADATVSELLTALRAQKFPVLYMPVTDRAGKLVGSLTFNQLIKAET